MSPFEQLIYIRDLCRHSRLFDRHGGVLLGEHAPGSFCAASTHKGHTAGASSLI